MKTKIAYNKHAILIVAGLALITSGLFLYKNISLRNQLMKEKIRSEVLLSEKLALQKSIDRINMDMTSIQVKSKNLENLALETSYKLHK